MSKRKAATASRTRELPHRHDRRAASPPLPMRAWLLFILAALCVARPLLPSEDAAEAGTGQPFALAWILLAAAYCGWAALHGGWLRRFDSVDLAVALAAGLCAFAAFSAKHEMLNSARFTLNMLWEWVALGLIFLLTRQLIRTRREARALVAVMISLAVAVAVFGLYQTFVTFPSERALINKDIDKALDDAGIWSPPGSPQRAETMAAINDPTPTSTFAAPDSLSGFLAPWLILMLGIGWSELARQGSWKPRLADSAGADSPRQMGTAGWVGLADCAGAIVLCLVLTKSGSAWVGLLTVAILLPGCDPAMRSKFGAKIGWSLAGVVAAIVLIAHLFGLLDGSSCELARFRLQHRIEIWKATLHMISEYSLLGVGPGNFLDLFTQYTTESLTYQQRDPQNWFFEVWATAGSFAAAALVVSLGLLIARTIRYRTPAPEAAEKSAGDDEDPHTAYYLIAGAAAGVLLAFFVGRYVDLVLSWERALGGILLGATVITILWPWIERGTLPARLPAVGALVLAVQLLGCGGIALAGVASTLWILMAIAVNQYQPEPAEPPWRVNSKFALTLSSKPVRGLQRYFGPRSVWGPWATCVAFLLAAWLAYSTACAPVFRLRAALAQIKAERGTTPFSPRIRAMYQEAAAADPWSEVPWMNVAGQEIGLLPPLGQKWRGSINNSIGSINETINKMTVRRQQSSAVWRLAGNWWFQLYKREPLKQAANTAIEYLSEAVRLDPMNPSAHAELAAAYLLIDDLDSVIQQADTALSLESHTPYPGQKLSNEVRKELSDLVQEHRAKLTRGPAQQEPSEEDNDDENEAEPDEP